MRPATQTNKTLAPLTPDHMRRIQGGGTLVGNPPRTNIAAFPDVCMTPPENTKAYTYDLTKVPVSST